MTQFKIAFFDIDGTLADNELPHEMGILQRIPASAKEALRQLKQNGIEPVIASGRNHLMLREFAAELGVESLVASNGTQVLYKGAELALHPIDQQTLKATMAEFDRQKIRYIIETPERFLATSMEVATEDAAAKYIEYVKDIQELPQDVIQLIVRMEDRNYLQVENNLLIAEKVAPVVMDVHLAQVSKATGVHEILEKLNIQPEEALAFGDEENDLAMFDAVGYPVAMGNACQALKAKAKFVTKRVGDDGIWHACEMLGLVK
ncbi:Cof-type HAD-IIB family hydrolase [Enterococcus sp. MJM12]|uniref:Cof-type HAD-IIB family hydrolase n=1 Tax=Candidatus Enterococcus myersii TaxID=2815322 RepID=A0ABS3H3W4_9ENTE|nr:Cof-type HAD-IIB family hydrolase [Enterococcus sp. MJM12]MBO0448147.1 Cof-type HAD-IIB family hydrolase [Enterococcus sp. MJM12]